MLDAIAEFARTKVTFLKDDSFKEGDRYFEKGDRVKKFNASFGSVRIFKVKSFFKISRRSRSILENKLLLEGRLDLKNFHSSEQSNFFSL